MEKFGKVRRKSVKGNKTEREGGKVRKGTKQNKTNEQTKTTSQETDSR